MSNEISRVYQFLAQFNKNGKTWVDEADTSGDGYVIKSEFRAFMEDFEWSGETTQEAKNDLINTFWKSIDTNKKTSKIKGTKLRNNNALDDNEIAAMEYRIKAYEILNNYLGTVKAPNVVRNSSAWKQKINESLLNKVEEFITSGRSIEQLGPYLESIGKTVQNMTTADICADEYLNSSEIKNILKEYNYTYDKGTELYQIISNFVQNIPEDSSPETIQETVLQIVDAYLATADLKEDDTAIDLADYGYSPNENSGLNELQKAVAEKAIRDNLASLKDEVHYEEYKDIYENAINEFINNTLSDANYSDFETVKSIGMEEFKKTDAYKNIELTVQVKAVFNGDNFKSAIKNNLTESVANRISGLMLGEIPAYDEIINRAVEKALNGDFDVNGAFNEDKLIEWAIGEIKASLIDFYPNGLGDMSIEELNMMYDTLTEAAREQNDVAKFKEAALMYCNALKKKNIPALNQAIEEIFGSNYADTINKLTSSEIDAKMEDLKTQALQFAEVSSLSDSDKDSFFAGVKDSYTIPLGGVETFNLPTSINAGSGVITSDRITFKCTGNVSVDANGKATITGSTPGTYNSTISVLIDNKVVKTKTITVVVENKYSTDTIVKNIKGWSGTPPDGVTVMREGNGNNTGDPIATSDFDDLYNNDHIICLGAYRDNNKYNWSRDGASVIKNQLANLGAFVISTLATAMPNVDSAALQKAMNNVVNRYAVNPSGDYYLMEDRGDTAENFYNYMKNNKSKVQNGLVQVKDNDGDDSNVYGIYFKEFVDAIIAEYNKLVQ